MATEVIEDYVAHGKELAQAGLESFHAASLPIQVAIGSAGFLLTAYGAYAVWFYGLTRRVKSKASLKGKTAIITGANCGIGRETAVDFATRGARVIIGCRNPKKAEPAVAEIKRRSGNQNVIFKQVDVSDLNSVRIFVDQILKEECRLDILVNNAGIGGDKKTLTPEGFDIVMATNHVGHFLLTMKLMDLLKKSAPSRIVHVSSLVHKLATSADFTDKGAKGIKGFALYVRSKLANVLFSRELARRLEGTGVTTYSVHPGAIYSSIWEKSWESTGQKLLYYIFLPILQFCMLSEKDGAQTSIYCAVEESIEHLSGRYFANCRLAEESKLGRDDRLARQLWEVSCEATGVNPNQLPE